MIEPSTVQALAGALVHTESVAEQGGWDADPVLLGLFDGPVTGADRTIEIVPFPLDPAPWRIADPHRPGHNLPVPVVLQALAHTLTSAQAPDWLPDWLGELGRTLIGFAFCCEGWATAGFAGYQPGDLNAVPAMADAEVRVVTAVDVDGRYYQVLRVRGEDDATLTTAEVPTPSMRDTIVVDALYRLATTISSANAPVANAHPSPSTPAPQPPAAAGQLPTAEAATRQEGTVQLREPMFLITDADRAPRGAIAVEDGRWIGRDTAGRPLFNRKDQAGATAAARRHGRLVSTADYGLRATGPGQTRSERIRYDRRGLPYVTDPWPMYVTPCCAATVTITIDDGALSCRACYATVDHRLAWDPDLPEGADGPARAPEPAASANPAPPDSGPAEPTED